MVSRSGKAGQKTHCACVICKPLFFVSELRGVRFSPATGESDGVLQVQHFVVEDVRDHVLGDVLMVQLAIQDNLVERGIETPQLRAPNPGAPSQTRLGQRTLKIGLVQALEKRLQIVMRTCGSVLHPTRPALAHKQKSPAGGPRV